MPKTSPTWNPAEYATVAERVTAFYAAFPFGRIVTELHSRDERQVTFRAEVFRSPEEPTPSATGWASEREGDGEVNAVACLENAETSAIGRALANLGFSAARARPGRHERAPSTERAVRPMRIVAEPAPGGRPTSDDAGASRGPDALLQRTADALLDALLLLAEAERAGLPAARAQRLERALSARSVAPSTIRRAERELRDWLAAHVPAPALPPDPADGALVADATAPAAPPPDAGR